MILHGRVRRSLILGRDWEPNGNIAEERYHAMLEQLPWPRDKSLATVSVAVFMRTPPEHLVRIWCVFFRTFTLRSA